MRIQNIVAVRTNNLQGFIRPKTARDKCLHIATNCGLNRRTLHRYFKSRQELLEACYSTMVAECKDAAKQAFEEAETPLLQLEQLLLVLEKSRTLTSYESQGCIFYPPHYIVLKLILHL